MSGTEKCGRLLFDDCISEEELGVEEEDVEDAVADLHGRTEHDRYVLHRHLVQLLLQHANCLLDTDQRVSSRTQYTSLAFSRTCVM